MGKVKKVISPALSLIGLAKKKPKVNTSAYDAQRKELEKKEAEIRAKEEEEKRKREGEASARRRGLRGSRSLISAGLGSSKNGERSLF